jgi:iron(III) transport system ATP-binding protein
MDSALHLDEVTLQLARTVRIGPVSFQVRPGEHWVLLGASGSGKTSLLRAIAGLQPLSAGSITLAGRVCEGPGTTTVPPEKRRVGLVFQDWALFPHLTAEGNVAFALPPSRRHEARMLLGQVGLDDAAERYPGELSGGEQQRVALARALAVEPSILLLDEPFSNLDPHLRTQVRRHTWEVLRARGLASVLVTHAADEALEVADSILLLHQGRCLQQGPPRTLWNHPAHLEVARALGATLELPAEAGPEGTATTRWGTFRLAAPVEARALILIARPHSLRLKAEGTGQAATDTQDHLPLPARVLQCRFGGPVWQIQLDIDGLGPVWIPGLEPVTAGAACMVEVPRTLPAVEARTAP